MPPDRRLNLIDDRIAALHRARIKPPLQRWIETHDTETLSRLRDLLEGGTDIITAIATIEERTTDGR
jgi:hypothetical protein